MRLDKQLWKHFKGKSFEETQKEVTKNQRPIEQNFLQQPEEDKIFYAEFPYDSTVTVAAVEEIKENNILTIDIINDTIVELLKEKKYNAVKKIIQDGIENGLDKKIIKKWKKMLNKNTSFKDLMNEIEDEAKEQGEEAVEELKIFKDYFRKEREKIIKGEK